MRKIIIIGMSFLISSVTKAQVYDAHKAFDPLFYTSNGSAYRSASGMPGSKYWQNETNYHIKADFDSTTHVLDGTEIIDYTNNSPDHLNFLWLELDQNAEKTGSRSKLLSGLDDTISTKGNGFKFKHVQLWQDNSWRDVDYEVFGTRMQIRPKIALKGSGEILKIKIDYAFKLLKSSANDRAGYMKTPQGSIFEFGYWFPRLCVYDDLRGWNTLPFIGGGEFYFEYGHIDYQITAPSGMLAVGSGKLLNSKDVLNEKIFAKLEAAKQSDKTIIIRSLEDVQEGIATKNSTKTTTWQFSMDNTRDVAFALSKAFIWDGAKINLPGGKHSFAQSVYPASSIIGDSGWTRATEYLKASVEDFSKRWFEYPYPEATNVSGPIGGMEFPALTFDWHAASGKTLWMLISHEIGHSWYPMIVGSDERRFPFMDEGFNTFIDIYAQEGFNKGEFAPKRDGEYAPNGGNPADEIVPVISALQNGSTLMTPPDWMDYKDVHPLAYFKTAFGLVLLREVILGHDRFDYAFRNYTKNWAFKHPSPIDFFRSMDNASGEDLSWFWKGWFYNNWQLDQAITGVKYVDDDVHKGALISIENKQQLPMPVSVKILEKNGRTHLINLPVEIWQRGAKWEFRAETSSKIDSIILDPDHQLPDMDRSNNVWKN